MIELARSYTAPIAITTAFTTAIDVMEILSGTGKPAVLLGFQFGQTTEIGDAQEEQIPIIIRRVTGAPTSGSGGGTSTFQSTRPNDTAAALTLETGNTTKLTGGTSVEMGRVPWNVRTDCLYLPVPEERIVFDAATRLVIELSAAPADSIGALHGRVSVGEII